MSPKGQVARVAKELNDLYDSLSQDAKDTWDEIGTLGYKPEKGFGGMWFARKNGKPAKEALGPAEHISVLHSMVKEDVEQYGPGAESDTPINLEDLPPSERLPGMEEPAIEELDRYGDKCIVAKEKKEAAATAFADACDEMRIKMRDHERKRYSRRGFSLVIEESEKLVIKKAEQAPAKNPSTKKQKDAPSLALV